MTVFCETSCGTLKSVEEDGTLKSVEEDGTLKSVEEDGRPMVVESLLCACHSCVVCFGLEFSHTHLAVRFRIAR
jgi:hypothetical protein